MTFTAPHLGILQPAPPHHCHIDSVIYVQSKCVECEWVGTLRTTENVNERLTLVAEARVEWANHHRGHR